METLMAIALLCQTQGGGLNGLKSTYNFQLRCQQEYIQCYYNKVNQPMRNNMNAVGMLQNQQFLYGCVQEKQQLPIMRGE